MHRRVGVFGWGALLAIGALLVGRPAAAQAVVPAVAPAVAPTVALVPLKASNTYQVGERVAWEIVSSDPALTNVSFTLQKNGLATYKTETLVLSNGKGVIETSLSEPGSVLLRVTGAGVGGRGGLMAGAMVSPSEIRPSVPKPTDFDAWWASKIATLRDVPIHARLTQKDSGRPDVDYALVAIDQVAGTRVQGQIAKPAREGKFPALVVLQWAGVYGLPSARVVDRAAEGWLALNIEPHDIPSDRPAEYYTELRRTTLNEYQAIGQQHRETSYFLRMYLAAYRALDYMASRPDWDGTTLVVQGTSMGGQQAIVMAGLHPKVSALVVMVPSGIDVTGPQHDRAAGFPDWARAATTEDDPGILETAQYFDPMNFASAVKVPALVAMGLYDTTSPPVGIWAAISQMKGPVEPLLMVSGHQDVNNSQGPYKVRSAEGLNMLVRGETPTGSRP